MRKIELVNGISSSLLGFGCAPILGAVDGKKATRALDCAIDCGITHFDIARSYGYGAAENFVGKHLKQKRKELVIATKFGIKANFKAKLLSPFKPAIRMGRAFLKGNKASVAAPENFATTTDKKIIADTFHDRIPLNEKEMLSSFHQSLKALQTDYVDYLFVHEPLQTVENIDELTACASKLKQEGKIRAWGLAFAYDQKPLHDAYLDKFDLLQFNNSPGSSDYQQIKKERSNDSNIFFSPLRGGSASLSPSEKLLQLSHDFDRSVILCSMFSEKHLVNNARLFS